MVYPYGLRNGPALGLSAPGLPRRQMAVAVGDTLGFPAKFIIVRTDQAIRVPDWVTYARMGATGKGGVGFQTTTAVACGGGGGGGFAGSNIIKATPGSLINVRFDATGTIVDGLGYLLTAGIGASATNGTGGAGGVGTGGDVNFNGGNGGTSTGIRGAAGGGGAAGRGGPGATGASVGVADSMTTGAAGSAYVGYLSGSASGGGGASGGGVSMSSAVSSPPAALGSIITVGLPGPMNSGISRSGGDGGGGSGGEYNANATYYPAVPGAGLALIEFW